MIGAEFRRWHVIGAKIVIIRFVFFKYNVSCNIINKLGKCYKRLTAILLGKTGLYAGWVLSKGSKITR